MATFSKVGQENLKKIPLGYDKKLGAIFDNIYHRFNIMIGH